jgi:hypothetical protein
MALLWGGVNELCKLRELVALVGLALTYSHWTHGPTTIGATCVSLASSECIEWFHTAIVAKPTSATNLGLKEITDN